MILLSHFWANDFFFALTVPEMRGSILVTLLKMPEKATPLLSSILKIRSPIQQDIKSGPLLGNAPPSGIISFVLVMQENKMH